MAREIEARSQLIKYDIATAAGDEEAQVRFVVFIIFFMFEVLLDGRVGTRSAKAALCC